MVATGSSSLGWIPGGAEGVGDFRGRIGCVNLGPPIGSRMDDISQMVLSSKSGNSEVLGQETLIVHCHSLDCDNDGRQPKFDYDKWTLENTKHTSSGVRCQNR